MFVQLCLNEPVCLDTIQFDLWETHNRIDSSIPHENNSIDNIIDLLPNHGFTSIKGVMKPIS